MSRRMPTQQDIRDQGLCGHGFNYGGPGGTPRYCGEPSESAVFFGSCAVHAQEWRDMCARIDAAQARIDAGEATP